MTSSANDSPHPSSSKKSSSGAEQDVNATDQKTPDALNDDIDNLDTRDKDKAGETEAGAQHPEPKITTTSPSPEVAIATVETPDIDNQVDPEVTDSELDVEIQDHKEAETIAGTEPTTAANNDITSSSIKNPHSENPPAENQNKYSKDDNQQTNLESKNNPQVSSKNTTEDNSDASELALNDANNDDDLSDDLSDENNVESEDKLTNDEEEQEEIKEEKESKLESYKQFVAEQFSNQKIDYPEIRVTIEANALPSKMYFVMNVLSAIIASYGLIANSAAVVIGAMLVAMMLGPITGVALAIIDYRMPLLRKSLFTVAAGGFLVIFVGFVVGWLHKGQPLTAEVLSRTQPTSMDLMIALAGGTAGAYAMVSPHLSVAVVGVAVATALVPPLAASGVLFANGELQLGFGAALLALTNIIAIQFTNAMVLWFLGFRRLVEDDYKSKTYLTFLRRNAVTLLLLIGLGIYLTINLNTNAKQQTFENNVKETINSYFESKGNVLTNTQFDRANGNEIVRAIIRGETTPSSYDVRQIEATITQNMKDNFPDYLPIKLQLRYLPVQVIESNPLIQDKLDETDAAILTN